MKLKEYMDRENLTDQTMADLLKKERSVVTRYRNGDVTPPIETIARIEEVTNGKVKFRDWVGDAAPARKVS